MLYRIFTENKTEAVDAIAEAMKVHGIDRKSVV